MTTLASENFKLVGYSGAINPEAHCQVMAPVVQLRGHDRFHRLITDDIGDVHFQPVVSGTEALKAQEKSGEVTILPVRFPAFSNPTAIFISEEFKNQVGLEFKFPGGRWVLTSVDTASSSTGRRNFLGVFAERDDVTRQRNEWADKIFWDARVLLKRDVEGGLFFTKAEREQERKVIRMGLDTATYPDLRRALFLADGLSARLAMDEARQLDVFRAAHKALPLHFSSEAEFARQVEGFWRATVNTTPFRKDWKTPEAA